MKLFVCCLQLKRLNKAVIAKKMMKGKVKTRKKMTLLLKDLQFAGKEQKAVKMLVLKQKNKRLQ